MDLALVSAGVTFAGLLCYAAWRATRYLLDRITDLEDELERARPKVEAYRTIRALIYSNQLATYETFRAIKALFPE